MEQMGVLWNALYGVRVIDGVGAVHLVLEASIETFGALPTIATALGNVAAAGFLLWAFQRAFLAPRPKDLLAAGFYPEPWLQLTDTATQTLSAHFHHE